MPDFACRLKKIRTTNNVTQKQLADYLNVTQNAVYNWENHKCDPNISTIKKIADYFGISGDYLVGLDSKQKPTSTSDVKMTKKEEKLLADFRKLNTEGQQYILQTMDMVKDKYKKPDSISELEDIG